MRAKVDLTAQKDVFLIDHSLSFRYSDLRSCLIENEAARQRLMYILKFSDKKKVNPLYPKADKAVTDL